MELFGPHGRTRTWLRHKKFKLLTSIGRTLGNDVVENALTSRRDLADFLADLQSSVPQGQVVDTSVTACDHRDWRAHFAGRLQGRGLELGPLHRPIPVHAGMQMTYVDYQDQATLQRAYPKLAEHIVPVDVLDDAADAGHGRAGQLRLPDLGARHRAHAQPDRRARQLAAGRPRRRPALPDRARQAPHLRQAARPHHARAPGARLRAAVDRARLRALTSTTRCSCTTP